MARTSQDIDAARALYTRISSIYDTLSDRAERRVRALGLSLLEARSGERILEIGFGTGSSLVALAESVGASGHVFGIDISPGMKDVAAARIRSANQVEQISLTLAAIPPIPFIDATFDAVFMAFTLELFPEDTIPIVLTEVRRTLSASGRLSIVSMTLGTEEQRQGLPERLYVWTHRHFPRIVDCRPIDVERRVTEAGFTIARVDRREMWGLPVEAILAY
jgi:ubiquinone/menaquinone biosynthesis C-methylase UbiE